MPRYPPDRGSPVGPLTPPTGSGWSGVTRELEGGRGEQRPRNRSTRRVLCRSTNAKTLPPAWSSKHTHCDRSDRYRPPTLIRPFTRDLCGIPQTLQLWDVQGSFQTSYLRVLFFNSSLTVFPPSRSPISRSSGQVTDDSIGEHSYVEAYRNCEKFPRKKMYEPTKMSRMKRCKVEEVHKMSRKDYPSTLSHSPIRPERLMDPPLRHSPPSHRSPSPPSESFLVRLQHGEIPSSSAQAGLGGSASQQHGH